METARRALRSFEAILREPKTDIVRDAAIRACFRMNIPNEDKARLGIAMADNRNRVLCNQIFAVRRRD